MNDIYELLLEQPFLVGLSDREIERLAACARRSMVHTGLRIFTEGGRADRFWLIQRGAVRLYVPVPGKGDLAVDTLGPHAVLGWSWLFHPYRWTCGATALEAVHTVEFDAARVRELCDSDPEFGYEMVRRFMKVVADRLRHLRRRVVHLHEAA
jgi:CRP/FNR family transcriptional regulator, cyclic AMP receptor protein